MAQPDVVRHEATAAELLTPMWRRQVDDLRSWEAQLHERQPEAVHQFRVATRRLRSSLAGFEPLFDDGASRALVKDLRWTAAAIGDGRDVQVVRAGLDALYAAESDAASSRLHNRLAERLELIRTDSWQRSLDHLDHADYDQFTRRLERFADMPPWLPAADLPADEALLPILRSEWERFRRSAQRALADPASPDDELLHQTRKASKRARYVAESLVGLFGRKAKRMGKAAQRVQVTLGDHQDSTLVREFLTEARHQLALDEHEAQTLARLQLREVAHMAALRVDIEQHLRGADRKSLRAWMR